MNLKETNCQSKDLIYFMSYRQEVKNMYFENKNQKVKKQNFYFS